MFSLLTPTHTAAEATTHERKQSVWCVCSWPEVLLSASAKCLKYCEDLIASIPEHELGKKRKGKGVKDFPWMEKVMATYEDYLAQGKPPTPNFLVLTP
jgi:hypothetical protein